MIPLRHQGFPPMIVPPQTEFKSSHPDLKSKQLAAFICGELFLIA